MENREKRPFRAARWILGRLKIYSSRYLIKEDLEEEYITLCESEDRRKARNWFWHQTLLALGYYVRYRRIGISFLRYLQILHNFPQFPLLCILK
jgi:hypothetical protein